LSFKDSDDYIALLKDLELAKQNNSQEKKKEKLLNNN